MPSLLLSETGHAQVACSVVNALTTALFRYHPVSVKEICKYDFMYVYLTIAFAVVFFVIFALRRVILLRSDIRLSAE